jgi:hypothetical protein
MTNLTSALNYGALITLSCCNAVLQIAAAPACSDPQDSNWPACAPGGDNVGRDWRIDGDRVCLNYDPGYRSQPECGAFEVLRGRLYMVEPEGRRKPVDSIEWRIH